MKINTHHLARIAGILFFVFGSSFAVLTSVGAEVIDTTTAKEVYLIKGELVSLTADGLERISITDPEVADILKADEEEILMVGKIAGQTTLFIWDKQGKRALLVHVFSQDLELIKERLEALFKVADINEATVEIDGREGKVVISGDIPKYKKEQFSQIVDKFSDDVLNLAKDEEIDDLIQIAVQITELSSTLSKSLGVNWTTGSSKTLSFAYPETLPDLNGSPKDYFKIGDFERTSALLATVNALIARGKARVLSQPKLVVKNGGEASFLVGGEIPIRTTTTNQSGGTQENVSFREYGISMNITPEIRKEKIDITLNVEISDIDASNAVGSNVAFTSRSAQTKLYLDNGQTIVLAGLIKQNRSEAVNKVPFLGDIPIVGLFFRNKSNPSADTDQELVIVLTPTILERNRGKTPVAAVQKVKAEETSAKEAESIVQEVKADSPAPPLAGPAQQNDAPAPPAVVETEAQTEAEAAVSVVAEPIISNVVPDVPALPEPVTSTAASFPPASPSNIDEYVQAVQQKISQAIVYPQEAERAGWEGTVKLSLLILSDGTLATAMIGESSGHEIFDQYTLNTAKNLAPYSSFPPNVDLRELTVTIPVVYSLKKN
ncbi:MAG: TonB family protein [Candidatus Omnitrophica bacterium]|nr:TonB family protein [Candidatus Omnitrophota bacterium]